MGDQACSPSNADILTVNADWDTNFDRAKLEFLAWLETIQLSNLLTKKFANFARLLLFLSKQPSNGRNCGELTEAINVALLLVLFPVLRLQIDRGKRKKGAQRQTHRDRQRRGRVSRVRLE